MQDAASVGLQPRIFHNHVFIRQTSTETQCAAGNGSDLRVAREMPLPSSSHFQAHASAHLNVITQLPPLGDESFLCGVKDPSLIPHWVSQ